MTTTPGRTRGISGLVFAGLTAAVSGVSVFVNSYGVHSVTSPAVYTTGKNFFAAILLLAFVVIAKASHLFVQPAQLEARRSLTGASRLLAFAYVAIIGGGVAFVMFFDGLARTSAVPAAFLHDTLVVWVALLAWRGLGEHVSRWNLVAIMLLVVGLVASSGGVGSLVANSGNALVLGATVLWGIETVIIKRLLAGVDPGSLGVVRMGGGLTVLAAYLAITGQLGALFHLDAHALGWVVLTGVLLGAYVATWMLALRRARAVDVTSILVSSALITAVLQAVVQHKDLAAQSWGLALVAIGTLTAAVAARRRTAYA
ncbi:MAG: DMT family transporter [Acidimicrobiales bacterium]